MSSSTGNENACAPVRRRRRLIVAGLAGIVLFAGFVVCRPVFHVLSMAWRDENNLPPIPPGFADDARAILPRLSPGR